MLKNYWWDSRRETLFQYLETTNVIHELLASTGKPQDPAIHYTNLLFWVLTE